MAYRTSPYLVCAFAAAMVSYPGPTEAQSIERAGQVAEINQSGFQIQAGGIDFLNQGDAVIRYARLETDGVGEMALAMDDGSQLVLLPNSDIVIDSFVYEPDSTVGQAVISLGRGALRMISGRMPSDRYQLNTPVATIGLRGTDFTAELVSGSGLVVRVDEGAVEIQPYESDDRFTVAEGQVSLCSATGCRDIAAGDPPLREARLGPPTPRGPGQGTGQGRRRDQARNRDTSGTEQTQSAATYASSQSASACAPFPIPDQAYRRVGLEPAQWPSTVNGITFYRHLPEGLEAKHYCPYQVKFSNSRTSFTVLGQATSGETKVLYYVNTLPGQDMFQSGFDRRAKEKDDAEAYKSFMSRVFEDQPGYRVVNSEANLDGAAPDRLVLQQRVHARVSLGDYQVTGVTMFRPAVGNRTGLFAIPAVVTPRQSRTALTAKKVLRPMIASVQK
ncbi:MAG: FecR domain-containing protein [Paracoccaceae bacterium]